MDWQTKVGLGITILMGLLPFTNYAPPPWLTWPGIAIGVLFIIWGLIPRHEQIPLIAILLFVASCAGIVASIVLYVQRGPESLPGAAAFAYIRLYDSPELRRRVVYEFRTPQGGGIKFFLSPTGLFNFTATDVNGEDYPLEIPIGAKGIPIDRSIFLLCEVGISNNYTILRVSVDRKQVGFRSLPSRIEIGDISHLQKMVLGADANGQNGAAFKIAELGLAHSTMSADSESKMMKYFEKYRSAIGDRD
jgi:hypothetical protein